MMLVRLRKVGEFSLATLVVKMACLNRTHSVFLVKKGFKCKTDVQVLRNYR